MRLCGVNFENSEIFRFLRGLKAEMEYCASMLAEEIWQIAEEFVEFPVNLQAQL